MIKVAKKKSKKWLSTEIISTICIVLFCVLIIIPFWNALVISFESPAEYARHPFSWWPRKFNLKNYTYLVGVGSRLLLAYRNTIVLTLVGTVAGMVVSVLAAYVFSRQFPGKKWFFRLAIFTMFFGGGLVPIYLQIRNMGLLDTWASTILIGLCSVYNIIIMKNGFEAVPMDLQEAAMIDGANDLKVFGIIMLPLQKPLIATFSLFTAVGYWNSWYWQAIFLKDEDKTVLQLFLRSIMATYDQAKMSQASAPSGSVVDTYSQGIQMAAVFFVILPIMCVYPFLQKYFVKGVLVGAVKM